MSDAHDKSGGTVGCEHDFVRSYGFGSPLDDTWELMPENGWTFALEPGRAYWLPGFYGM